MSKVPTVDLFFKCENCNTVLTHEQDRGCKCGNTVPMRVNPNTGAREHGAVKVGNEEFPIVGYGKNGIFEYFYYRVRVDGIYLFTEVNNVDANGTLVKGALRAI